MKEALQTATEEELTSHLGYEKHKESDNPNYRNGHNKKTVKSKYGEVELEMPRDRQGTFYLHFVRYSKLRNQNLYQKEKDC